MLNVSTMPPRVRQVIYYIFAIAGVAFGAVEIAIGDPHWLTVAMTVLSFVGSSIGVLAGAHTGYTKIGSSAPVDGSGASTQPVTASTSEVPSSASTDASTPKRAEVDMPSDTVTNDAGVTVDVNKLPEPNGGDTVAPVGGATEVNTAGI